MSVCAQYLQQSPMIAGNFDKLIILSYWQYAAIGRKVFQLNSKFCCITTATVLILL